MIVDLTLDRLRLPALENFDPAFGKKELSGGVSTENVCNDVMLPFSKQRPIILTENSTTKADATRGDVQADCRLEFSQAGLTFALGVPSCAGIKAEFIGGFSTSGTSSVSYTATSGAATKNVSAGQKVTLVATSALEWEEKELFQGGCVLASSSSIAGPTLAIGDIVKVMFTSDLTAPDETTALGLSYNGTSFPVKASSGGSLVGLFAHEVTSGTFKYLQAYTTLELVFDGTNFVVVGNPVVLSSSDYTIYADGKVGDGNIGDIKGGLYSTAPYGWILCNNTVYNKADYPKLWDILPSTVKNISNNTFTIDLRGEFLRGAGTNGHSGQGNGGTVGQHQDNATAKNGLSVEIGYTDLSHYHDSVPNAYNMPGYGGYYGGGGMATVSGTTNTGGASMTSGGSMNHIHTAKVSGDTETRPTNTSVTYIIKAM